MSITRRYRPRLEALEDRALPSTLPILPSPFGAATTGHSHPRYLALFGIVNGTWTSQPGMPDVGASQTLTGNGSVSPLGPVQVSAALQLTGMLVHGHATGMLTLTSVSARPGPSDSVTVRLTGPAQPGFSGPPKFFYFSVVSGTGQFRHVVGYGKVNLSEWSEGPPPPHCPPGSLCPVHAPSQLFSLMFHPRPAPVSVP